MFEDIIGEVENKKGDASVIKGDGITTCPSCGSYSIVKGAPLYLIQKSKTQRCDCKSCNASWSLHYDYVNKKYKYELTTT